MISAFRSSSAGRRCDCGQTSCLKFLWLIFKFVEKFLRISAENQEADHPVFVFGPF